MHFLPFTQIHSGELILRILYRYGLTIPPNKTEPTETPKIGIKTSQTRSEITIKPADMNLGLDQPLLCHPPSHLSTNKILPSCYKKNFKKL